MSVTTVGDFTKRHRKESPNPDERLKRREFNIWARLHGEGWTVFHRGLPDFVAFKLDETPPGKWMVKFVEVKGKKDRLTVSQDRIMRLMVAAGLEYELAFVD